MLSSDPSARRQRSLRLEAVVLKHSDWGEADRLVWLFSREQGKLTRHRQGRAQAALAQGRAPGAFHAGFPAGGTRPRPADHHPG